jgi:hypothetical protein
MSLNKRRNRLIKKYHKMLSGHPINLNFSTDGSKTFMPLGNIPGARSIRSGNINARKISVDGFGFKNFEITISQGFTKEEFNELNGGVL